jgi:hypothetical protein
MWVLHVPSSRLSPSPSLCTMPAAFCPCNVLSGHPSFQLSHSNEEHRLWLCLWEITSMDRGMLRNKPVQYHQIASLAWFILSVGKQPCLTSSLTSPPLYRIVWTAPLYFRSSMCDQHTHQNSFTRWPSILMYFMTNLSDLPTQPESGLEPIESENFGYDKL